MSQSKEQTNTPQEDMFDTRTFEAKLIKSDKMRNITDFLYNEAVLNRLILQAEIMKESYAIGRLSLLGSVANKPIKMEAENNDAAAADAVTNAAKQSVSESETFYRTQKDDSIL